ncbi:MAG: sugar-phosphatase [Enterococcus sp.]
MSIKLIAIDIDGTLLNDQRQLTPTVKSALNQARQQGVKVVLCTGRPIPGIQDLLIELELLGVEDYAITYNGSLVQNTHNGQIISQHGIDYEQYIEIEMMARKLNVHFHASGEDAIYTANRDISPYTVFESSLVNMPVKYRTQEEMNGITIVKTMMIDEPEILAAANAKLPEAFREKYTVVKSAPYYLEVLNKNANKGIAVKALADYLGIKQEETMAIGDNENDLAMIDYAGISVAMKNALPIVKERADYTTKTTNNEDGVAEAVHKFVL